MVPTNRLSSDDFRNIGQALMMQDSIGIISVSAQFFFSDFSRLTIFRLQLHQPQSLASNTSLVGAFRCQLLAERFLGLTKVGEGVRSVDNDMLQGCYMSRRSVRRAGVSQRGVWTLKDSRILSLKNFLLTLALLRVVRQSISSSISLALAIIDAEIVAGQLLGQADLARAQALRIHEPIQVVMIGQHQDLVLAAFQIVAPIFKRLDNG